VSRSHQKIDPKRSGIEVDITEALGRVEHPPRVGFSQNTTDAFEILNDSRHIRGMIDDHQFRIATDSLLDRIGIHPPASIAGNHCPTQSPAILKIRQRSQDTVVFGGRRDDMLAAKIRLPQNTMDRRMDGHRPVASPSHSIRIVEV
jgi:hypothetical protein